MRGLNNYERRMQMIRVLQMWKDAGCSRVDTGRHLRNGYAMMRDDESGDYFWIHRRGFSGSNHFALFAAIKDAQQDANARHGRLVVA